MWLKQLLQAFYAGVTSRGVSYAVLPVVLHAVPVFFRTIPAELNWNRLCSLFNQIQAKILSLHELSWLGKAVSSAGSHYQRSQQAPWIGFLRLQGCSPSHSGSVTIRWTVQCSSRRKKSALSLARTWGTGEHWARKLGRFQVCCIILESFWSQLKVNRVSFTIRLKG